jgi:protease II
VGVGRTRSGAYLILGIGSLTTAEARFLPADEPAGEWKTVAPRVKDQEYDVDHHGDSFYIRANDSGRNFRLVTAPVASPDRPSWHEVLPHRSEVMLEAWTSSGTTLSSSSESRGFRRSYRRPEDRRMASHGLSRAAYSVFAAPTWSSTLTPSATTTSR